MKRSLKYLLKLLVLLFLLLNIVVIFHAYKFTRFYNTGDSSVKLQAQKSGWDKTTDILFGINAAKKPEAAADSSRGDMQLLTADNIKLDCWDISVPNAKGTIIMFHGHGGNKTDLLPQAMALQQMGFNTFMVGFRAHGNSGGNTSTIGFKEVEDVRAAYELIQKRKPAQVILYGVSLGAATIAKAVKDFSLVPNKIILEMPFGSIEAAVEGRVKMMKLPVEPISTLLTFWGGTIHGFWAFGMKPTEYVKAIKCPVLLQWGAKDTRVSQKETDEIYANISSPKKLVVFENAGHENLYKNDSSKWLQNVGTFLR